MDTFVDMVMYAIRINMYAAGEGLGWGRGGEGEGGEVEGREREAPKLLLNQGPSEPCHATGCTVCIVAAKHNQPLFLYAYDVRYMCMYVCMYVRNLVKIG